LQESLNQNDPTAELETLHDKEEKDNKTSQEKTKGLEGRKSKVLKQMQPLQDNLCKLEEAV
jgi:hypothetical protein